MILLLGWIIICVNVPAHAQTEEKTLNAVNTAAILARLNSRTAYNFTADDSRRPKYLLEHRERTTEENRSSRHTKPVSDYTMADGEDGEAPAPALHSPRHPIRHGFNWYPTCGSPASRATLERWAA